LIPAAACLKATAEGAAVLFDAIPTKTKPVSLSTSVVAAIHVKPTEAEVEYVGDGSAFLTVRSGIMFLKPTPLFTLNVVLNEVIVQPEVDAVVLFRFAIRFVGVMTISVTVCKG